MSLEHSPCKQRLAYRIHEFAKATGLGRSTIYKLIKQEKLKVTKVGGASLILHEDGMATLKACRDEGQLSKAA